MAINPLPKKTVSKSPSQPVAKAIVPEESPVAQAGPQNHLKIIRSDEVRLTKPVFYGLIGVLLIALAIGAYFYFVPSGSNTAVKDKLATVNGEPIYRADIEKTKQLLQLRSQAPVTDEIALNQSINTIALLIEAKKQGITFTEADAEKELIKLLKQSNLTLEQFKQQLLTQGTTSYADAISDFKDQMTIEALIKKNVNIPTITDAEALSFYTQNKALFEKQAAAGATSNKTKPKAPKFEQVSDQIKSFLEQQNSQGDIISYVKSVRAAADVKLL